MVSAICCAQCCSVFSVTGVIFLVVIGILLQKQPLYVRGPHDPSAAAAGCYQGAAIYVFTFFVSISYWFYDKCQNRSTGSRGQASSKTATSAKGGYGALANN